MALARNSTFGASPLVTGATGTISTSTSSAFSCSSSAKVVLVAVGLGNTTGTVNQPVRVEWVGGTPANAREFEKVSDGQNSGNNHTGEVWVSRLSGALSSVQVVATAQASSASSAVVLGVDVLDATGAVIVSAVGQRGTNASAVAAGVTLPAVLAGSWLYGVGSGEGAATWSPVSNFTELGDQRDAGTANAAFGLNDAGTAGDILVGWSNTVDYGGWSAIEVREQETIGAQDGFAGGWYGDLGVHLNAYGTPSDALWPDTAAEVVLWEIAFPAAGGSLDLPASDGTAGAGVLTISATLGLPASAGTSGTGDFAITTGGGSGSLDLPASSGTAASAGFTITAAVGLAASAGTSGTGALSIGAQVPLTASAGTAASASLSLSAALGLTASAGTSGSAGFTLVAVMPLNASPGVAGAGGLTITSDSPAEPSGPSSMRPTRSGIGRQRPWHQRLYHRRMRGHS